MSINIKSVEYYEGSGHYLQRDSTTLPLPLLGEISRANDSLGRGGGGGKLGDVLGALRDGMLGDLAGGGRNLDNKG